MADNGGKDKEYKTRKRKQKRIKKKPGPDKVFVCNDILKEIFIDADEASLTGTVTFKTVKDREIIRPLVYTWLPQGIWKFKILEKADAFPGYRNIELQESINVDKKLENRIKFLGKSKRIIFFTFAIEADKSHDEVTECLYKSAVGKVIPITVTYAVHRGGGKGEKITPIPFSDDYLPLLKIEMVARIYIALLEHFAGINVDPALALHGISRAEYKKIVNQKSNHPDFDAKKIARVVTRGAYEFAQADGKNWSCLLLMLETILYQMKCHHPWALANQLEIGQGENRSTGFKTAKEAAAATQSKLEIGIKRRGSFLLLYDQFGNPIPAFVGFRDLHYRDIDLNTIPAIQVSVEDSGLGDFLKVLEQTFAFPQRETTAFLAGVCKFYQFIAYEIHRIYGGEIEKKIMQMLPTAIGFFVVHSVVGVMARRGNPYAAAILVAFKALGWLMNIDLGMKLTEDMMEAGIHFIKMETVQRRNPKEKGKEKLTELSRFHLHQGTKALIRGMAELIAMGVFWAGAKAGGKTAKEIANRIKLKSRREASLEIFVDKNGNIEKIKLLRGKKRPLEVEVQKPGGKGQKPIDMPPLEESATNIGRRPQTAVPKQSRVIKIEEFDFSKLQRYRAGEKIPKAFEQETGMLQRHFEAAIEIAKQNNWMVLLRQTNPASLELIARGYPPKPKNLIDINTSKTTGKVTASDQAIKMGPNKGKTQLEVAHEHNFYTLDKNGLAYRMTPKGREYLKGTPGSKNSQEGWKVNDQGQVQYDMTLKKGAKPAFEEGEVIDPGSKKSIVGDYDVQDVIRKDAPKGWVVDAAGKSGAADDFRSETFKKFMDAFNKAIGEKRVVHGADAQFYEYWRWRSQQIKGEIIGITPDGKVVKFKDIPPGQQTTKLSNGEIAKHELQIFMDKIGRRRADSRQMKKAPEGKTPEELRAGFKVIKGGKK